MRWMALSAVPVALFTLHGQVLLGIGQVRDGIAVLSLWGPLFSLVGIFVLAPSRGVEGAIWAYDAAAVLTLGIGVWRWRKATPQLAKVKAKFRTSELLRSSGPLFWVTVFQMVIVWIPTLLLGTWGSSADVGVFAAASRTVLLTSFILFAVNSITSPKFSMLHKQGDLAALERVAKDSTKLIVLVSGPILLVFWLLPEHIITVFGAQFASGATVLSILAIGQFVNMVTGPAGNLLMMCGHERLVRNNIGLCAIICVLLNVSLIPTMGLTGAAIAGAATLAIENLLMAWAAWWKLKILTIPMSIAR